MNQRGGKMMQYKKMRGDMQYPPMMDDADTTFSSDAQGAQEAMSGTAQ